MPGKPGLHRRRSLERSVDAAEVVVREIQCRRCGQTLKLLAEHQREPGEPPKEGPDAEVAPLDMAGADIELGTR